MINLRSRAEEVLEDIILTDLAQSDGGIPRAEAVVGRTEIYWNGNSYTGVPIWERSALRDGDQIAGPAIITEVILPSTTLFLLTRLQMDSNTIVMPDHRAEVDRFGNILLWLRDSEGAVRNEAEDNQRIITELVEAALANARLEMDGLILRSALSPAMSVNDDWTISWLTLRIGVSNWIMYVFIESASDHFDQRPVLQFPMISAGAGPSMTISHHLVRA